MQIGTFAGTNNKRQRLIYDFSDFTYEHDVEKIVGQVEDYLDKQNTKALPFESVCSYFSDSDAASVITFVRDTVSDEQAKAFRKQIRDTVPKFGGVKAYFDDDDQPSGGGSAFFSLYLNGEDLDSPKKLAREAEGRVAKVSGVEDVRLDASSVAKRSRWF